MILVEQSCRKHSSPIMSEPIREKLQQSLLTAEGLYHREVLLVGESGFGKTKVLRAFAGKIGTEVININLLLSAELLGLSEKQRMLHLSEIPDKIVDKGHHVRRNRGELLFARTWLLVEGETDVSVFVECAEILGINLHQLGIRVVEYSQVDLKIFIKAADALGIQWHVVADNDDGGQKYIDAAKALLGDRQENDCITKLTSQNTDILLCRSGYGQPYRDGVTYKTEAMLTAPVGSDEYWCQVYQIVNKQRFSKPKAAFDALEIMRNTGAEGVPPEIVDIFKKIISQPGDN